MCYGPLCRSIEVPTTVAHTHFLWWYPLKSTKSECYYNYQARVIYSILSCYVTSWYQFTWIALRQDGPCSFHMCCHRGTFCCGLQDHRHPPNWSKSHYFLIIKPDSLWAAGLWGRDGTAWCLTDVVSEALNHKAHQTHNRNIHALTQHDLFPHPTQTTCDEHY